jgi:hypothetical protein
VKNGPESDKDCGGTCPKCLDLLHCGSNADCLNNLCFGSSPGTCVSCSDGTKDGNETAKDCGGFNCNALGLTCGAGLTCSGAVDCTSNPGCTGSSYTAPATCSGVCVAGTVTDCSGLGQVCNPLAGCVACNAPSDCPATGNECTTRTCTGNVCGVANLGATHTLSTGQSPGDCQKIVCNGAGGITSIDDPTDLPTSSTVCLSAPACSGSPLTPSFTPATPGTDCTADGQSPKTVCGSGAFSGVCVQCNVNSDCNAINDASTLTCSAAHVCQ